MVNTVQLVDNTHESCPYRNEKNRTEHLFSFIYAFDARVCCVYASVRVFFLPLLSLSLIHLPVSTPIQYTTTIHWQEVHVGNVAMLHIIDTNSIPSAGANRPKQRTQKAIPNELYIASTLAFNE